MVRSTPITLVLAAAAVSVGAAQGPPTPARGASAAWLLDGDREVRLALSAAPPSVAAEASVYLLGADGYRLHRGGSSGFTCLVERSHAESLEPICYDREASAAILPRVFAETTARMVGKDSVTIRRETAEGYRTGRYRPPQRTALAYMLAPEQHTHDSATGRNTPIPPHLMFYAPFLTNADLGLAAGAEARGARHFVVDEGSPTAFIVVLVDPAATGAGE